ncbi:hypothetical protein Tco_0835234 [Tanacetum coccineum]
MMELIQTQQKLLTQLGFHVGTNNPCGSNGNTTVTHLTPQTNTNNLINHVGFQTCAIPSLIGPVQPLSSLFGPLGYPSAAHHFSAQHATSVGFNSGTRTILNQYGQSGSNVVPGQEMILPNVFSATTPQDPTTGAWNMNTGASSHLNDSVSSLSDVLDMCIYPSVSVGDGYTIPVTNSGHNAVNERVNITNMLGAYFAATNFFPSRGLGWNSHGHSEMTQRKKAEAEPAPPARDPRDVETIKRLQQRIQELELQQLQSDLPTEKAETDPNI